MSASRCYGLWGTSCVLLFRRSLRLAINSRQLRHGFARNVDMSDMCWLVSVACCGFTEKTLTLNLQFLIILLFIFT